jgi:opacity protein-like surface antigen
MKKIILFFCCFLLLFCGLPVHSSAQAQTFDNIDEEQMQLSRWARKGFELFIGAGIYFGSKQTANYYNGAPDNTINLRLLFDNKYHREDVLALMKEAYRYIDTIILHEAYNYDTRYNIAMDISLGARYRVHKNWYLELSYSFRRLASSSAFIFDFPGVPPGNSENPYNKHYSRNEYLVAKEDRHYIDFSVGYIFQKPDVLKPFISIGALFSYTRIKDFQAIIENKPFDLMNIARYPGYIPGISEMPNYMDWAGAGYGFSLTAGFKIAVHSSVSIDPFYQMSVASFGNSANLPGFNTSLCFNHIAGVRLVINDAIFLKKQ